MREVLYETKGRTWGPTIAAIVIWQTIELIVLRALHSEFGTEWIVSMIGILVSAGIGLPLLYLAMAKFGKVERDASDVRQARKGGDTKFRNS
jgi:hypothetical protein